MMKIFRAPPLPTRITLAIAGFFVLCQVMGVMCAIPDLAMAGEEKISSQEGIVCHMDGTNMCPPSATSSPERQDKHTLILDSDHAPTVLVSATVFAAPLVRTLRSRSSPCSIVSISIDSSSVLRI